MKGDIPLPALRLLSALPVRTVERKPRIPMSRQLAHYYEKKKRPPRHGSGLT